MISYVAPTTEDRIKHYVHMNEIAHVCDSAITHLLRSIASPEISTKYQLRTVALGAVYRLWLGPEGAWNRLYSSQFSQLHNLPDFDHNNRKLTHIALCNVHREMQAFNGIFGDYIKAKRRQNMEQNAISALEHWDIFLHYFDRFVKQLKEYQNHDG